MQLLKPLLSHFKPQSLQLDNHEKVLASLMVMAWVVEARDPYTGGHLWRVARFAQLLAHQAGISAIETAKISIGGFLHDLGKVGIPDAILSKKDKLTDEEYAVIKTHPDIGRRMIAGHPLASLAIDAIYMHHETPDGRGYPSGLQRTQIPVVAKIIGVCDAFDAMTSTRPYRQGMPIEKALSIIKANIGTQFDPEFSEYLLQLADSDQLSHIVGHSDEGIPLHDCLMCGPTIVVQSHAKKGDLTYCRACQGEYKLEEVTEKSTFKISPTGAKGSAQDLVSKPDETLISKLINESAKAIQQIK
ncbi:HD-GYP domain-containing protein [Methylotenera mobilis]|uniref:Metal dependent phosphohydrolase n=1 Tax=Methylotenera mobilis (strain JLW8 / ATCC BAA-1282 / DSM 17540) TaxID=583345 RepID=C6WXN5_METML|nr:HD-GYP domain-containing protein [Methylotenera mobilis]ACT48684.1 metal dependent phosphohydrolase [Methylotenera mobilis JLW8]